MAGLVLSALSFIACLSFMSHLVHSQLAADLGTKYGNNEKSRLRINFLRNIMYIPDPEKSIQTDGNVWYWTFYARRDGPIYLQIWRPVSTNRYTLVGQEFYQVSRSGYHIIHPEEGNRISVRKGDVAGFYTPGSGIIPYDIGSSCNRTMPYLSISVGFLSKAVVSPGKTYAFSRGTGKCRTYSFSTTITAAGFEEHGGQTVYRQGMDSWRNAVMIPEPHVALSEGAVLSWRFFARRSGLVYLQVWRPTGNRLEYELVGQTSQYAKYGINGIINNGKIDILDGDVIGMYFPGSSIIPFDGRECNDQRGLYYRTPPSGKMKNGAKFVFQSNLRGWRPCREYSISYTLLKGSWIGRAAKPRPSYDKWSNAMFIPNPDKPIEKTGYIVGWRFYSEKKNPITLLIFRPVWGIRRYRIIALRKSFSTGSGLQHRGIPAFKVQRGDVIGFYFPGGSVLPFDGTECFSFDKRGFYVKNPQNVRVGQSFMFDRNRMGWKPCREYSFGALLASASTRKKRNSH